MLLNWENGRVQSYSTPDMGRFTIGMVTVHVRDLAAVEASFDRSRLLTEQGADVAAMALDFG